MWEVVLTDVTGLVVVLEAATKSEAQGKKRSFQKDGCYKTVVIRKKEEK